MTQESLKTQMSEEARLWYVFSRVLLITCQHNILFSVNGFSANGLNDCHHLHILPSVKFVTSLAQVVLPVHVRWRSVLLRCPAYLVPMLVCVCFIRTLSLVHVHFGLFKLACACPCLFPSVGTHLSLLICISAIYPYSIAPVAAHFSFIFATTCCRSSVRAPHTFTSFCLLPFVFYCLPFVVLCTCRYTPLLICTCHYSLKIVCTIENRRLVHRWSCAVINAEQQDTMSK